MNVFVTGTEGYIGHLLPPLLMERGHDVLGVDTGFYKAGWLYHANGATARTLNKDIRHLSVDDLRGFDAVVHMAELSNDPVGELAPNITFDINHKGSVHLADLAKAAGVSRYIYTSSCSVYGVATEERVSEESPVNPQTAYAVCKTLVERDVAPLADDSFSPTFLRNATAMGASPRMRFDIVVNNLSGLACTTKEIKMDSDGTPWRPLVHALDICKAIACTLEAPRDVVHNEVFNVGDSSSNYQVKDIAEIVGETFAGCSVSLAATNGADNRSYRVSFDKINEALPGFHCDWDVERTVRQLAEIFDNVDLTPELFLFRGFTRLKQIQYLIRTGQIDQDFFWRTNGAVH